MGQPGRERERDVETLDPVAPTLISWYTQELTERERLGYGVLYRKGGREDFALCVCVCVSQLNCPASSSS